MYETAMKSQLQTARMRIDTMREIFMRKCCWPGVCCVYIKTYITTEGVGVNTGVRERNHKNLRNIKSDKSPSILRE
jgi:hypothetical protein